MKRTLSFVLSIVMGLSVFAVNASAAQETGNSAERETFTVKGRAASSAMVEMLEEEGITVTEDTVIELVPLSSAESGVSTQSADEGNVLVITNQEGTVVRKDVLLPVTDNGIGFTSMDEVMARASNSYDYKLDKAMVRGTAFYEQYVNVIYYYRPLKVEFFVRKYQPCDVSSVGVTYTCCGGEHTYPNLEFVKITTHNITIRQNDPVVMKVYSRERPLSSGRVICTAAGGGDVSGGHLPGNAGNSLTIEMTIDGKYCLQTAPV